MKKVLLLSFILIAVCIPLVLLIIDRSITIEQRLEELLELVYSSDYSDYMGSDYDEEYVRISEKKEKKFENLFTEKGFKSIKNNLFMHSSGITSIRDRCSIDVTSVVLDIREVEDDSVRVCYYTVIAFVDYIDDYIEPESIEITGTMALYLEEGKWKIGKIVEDRFPFSSLKKTRKK